MHALRQYGDRNAPLILFLHGGGVGGWMWRQQVDYFTKYHCIVPELVRPDVGEFTIESSAEQALGLIRKHARGKPVAVVGFSLGAQILVRMLAMEPKTIDYAVINSALVGGMPYGRWLLPAMRMAMPLVRNRSFAQLQARTLYVGEDDFEAYYEGSKQTTWASMSAVMKANMTFRIPERFEEAEGRILVTVGADEKAIMHRSMRELVQANANCAGCILPNVGHGAPLATPELFNGIVEAWINGGSLPASIRAGAVLWAGNRE